MCIGVFWSFPFAKRRKLSGKLAIATLFLLSVTVLSLVIIRSILWTSETYCDLLPVGRLIGSSNSITGAVTINIASNTSIISTKGVIFNSGLSL